MAKKSKELSAIAKYFGLFGLILAVAHGIVPALNMPGVDITWLPIVLVVLGVVVGAIALDYKDVKFFVVVLAAVILPTGLAIIPTFGPILSGIFQGIAILVTGMATVPVLRFMWDRIITIVLVATGGGFVTVGIKEFISQYIPFDSSLQYIIVGLVLILVGWVLVEIR